MEATAREPGNASSLDAPEEDKGTTRTIVTAYGLAATLPLVLRRIPAASLPRAAAPAGLILQAAGLALRGWSMHTLGQFYSRTLRTEGERHAVVDTGPYRLIRHPGYAGSLLTWTGFALTSRSTPVAAAVVGLLSQAYYWRIAAEEQLLRQRLPGYTAYSERTKRLTPFIW